ncbi:hypothetical protein TNCV_569901 [Trichonephila clavipes]|nr:hypothetical protein TNCV_569901 [Trichonephila clavipes]
MATGSYMSPTYSRSQSEVQGDLHNSPETLEACGTAISRLTLPLLTRTRSYAIFKSHRFAFYLRGKEYGKIDHIGNAIEDIVDFARQINFEVKSDDVRELLHFRNQELTIDELIEMHEQEQDIEKLKSLDPVPSEPRMAVGN